MPKNRKKNKKIFFFLEIHIESIKYRASNELSIGCVEDFLANAYSKTEFSEINFDIR